MQGIWEFESPRRLGLRDWDFMHGAETQGWSPQITLMEVWPCVLAEATEHQEVATAFSAARAPNTRQL